MSMFELTLRRRHIPSSPPIPLITLTSLVRRAICSLPASPHPLLELWARSFYLSWHNLSTKTTPWWPTPRGCISPVMCEHLPRIILSSLLWIYSTLCGLRLFLLLQTTSLGQKLVCVYLFVSRNCGIYSHQPTMHINQSTNEAPLRVSIYTSINELWALLVPT